MSRGRGKPNAQRLSPLLMWAIASKVAKGMPPSLLAQDLGLTELTVRWIARRWEADGGK